MLGINLSLLPAFVLFAFVASITPGPNNTMLLSAGANFGFVRTLPHILGVSLGTAFLVMCVALGLGAVLKLVPYASDALRLIGAAYMCYLAWKIAFSRSLDERRAAQPMTFLQAAAFQWVNPKVWMIAFGAVATYSFHHQPLANALTIAAVLTVVNFPSISVWAAFGVAIRRLLTSTVARRTFNLVMGLLLVGSLYPIVEDFLRR